MAQSQSETSYLKQRLADAGLVCFGGLEITSHECASGQEALIGKRGLLIGNAGKDMWRVFSKSPEFLDGDQDPMNRWTKRILDEIAGLLGARVVYPFDEPYWPFQRLAQKAAGVKPSPLGILIHSEFGLWHAFRGMLVFENIEEYDIQFKALTDSAISLNHACDNCTGKPCLSACPVGAFTGDLFDVQSCFAHLETGDDPDCMQLGCQARCACPLAKEYQYDNAQIQFHMNSFSKTLF